MVLGDEAKFHEGKRRVDSFSFLFLMCVDGVELEAYS